MARECRTADTYESRPTNQADETRGRHRAIILGNVVRVPLE